MTAAAPASEEATRQARERIAQLCEHLGADAAATARIVDSGCLQLEGIDFALRLNEANLHLEFFGDCGQPLPYEQDELHCHLLEEALANDLPALCFARHPTSGHVVAKGSLYLPAIDEAGWLFAALLLTALSRIHALRTKFALHP